MRIHLRNRQNYNPLCISFIKQQTSDDLQNLSFLTNTREPRTGGSPVAASSPATSPLHARSFPVVLLSCLVAICVSLCLSPTPTCHCRGQTASLAATAHHPPLPARPVRLFLSLYLSSRFSLLSPVSAYQICVERGYESRVQKERLEIESAKGDRREREREKERRRRRHSSPAKRRSSSATASLRFPLLHAFSPSCCCSSPTR